MARRTVDGPTPGFHEGEIAVQLQAGVSAEAQHLVGMLDPVELGGGVVDFLAERTFAVLSARDAHGTLWASPLTGPQGFLEVTGPHDLDVATAPAYGDPLRGLPAGQDVALLAIEFARRRRFRINGRLSLSGDDGLRIRVEQAYGNCPQYIQQRTLVPNPRGAPQPVEEGLEQHAVSDRLTQDDLTQISLADTFFLGTAHPTRGTDASHRGGQPGFVRVEDDRTLWWPDYQGNNMFNSHGNIAVDPATALLFVDFNTGRTVHLHGRAVLETVPIGTVGDDGHTGRRVRFNLDARSAGALLPMSASGVVASRHNPVLHRRQDPRLPRKVST